jgi:hypothetical protein
MRVWDNCVILATELVSGELKKKDSTVGNRNVYINPDTANSVAKRIFGKILDLPVGNHKFGYAKDVERRTVPVFTKNATPVKNNSPTGGNIYVVKKGDSLFQIA